MCKRLICLTAFVVVLALAGNATAQLDPLSITDGHVYLFEDVGADVPDDSAGSHAANILGSPQVVDGLRGKALQLNGTSDGVHIPDDAAINLSTHQNHTVIAIFNCADVTKSEKQVVYEEGGSTRGLVIYVHEGLVYAGAWNRSDYTHRNGQKHFSLRRSVPTNGSPLLRSSGMEAQPRKTTSLKCGWTES